MASAVIHLCVAKEINDKIGVLTKKLGEVA